MAISTVERDDMARLRTLTILVVLLSLGSSCSNSADSSSEGPPPSVVVSAQRIAEAAAEDCGPDGRDQLHDDADSENPSTAARWYADRLEPQWQLLAEEACYLALVNAK